MKRTILALVTVFSLSAPSFSQIGDYWVGREQVARAADELAVEVENFDEILHSLNAPNAFIGKVHHLEETVIEFTNLVRTSTYQEADHEFNHLKEDVGLIRTALKDYPSLANNLKVKRAFNYVRSAAGYVEHALLVTDPGPLPSPSPTPNPTPTPTPTPGVTALNGVEYEVLEPGTLVSTANNVKGTGVLQVKKALAEEDNNFALNFTLADKGALTLVANAEKGLKDGANLTFARDGKTLKVLLKVGSQEDDLSTDFENVAADSTLSIAVDVHGHGHLIIWVGEGEEQEYAFNADLEGTSWGLRLTDASLNSIKADKPKEEHEHEHR